MDRRRFVRLGGIGLAGVGGIGATDLTTGLEAGARVDSLGLLYSPDEPIRLNANENPLGLSDAARRAVVESLGEANRYPRAWRERMVDHVARHFGVSTEQVVLGNGSTEVLQMAVQAYGGAGTTMVVAEPTFEDVPRYAAPFSYRVATVPLTSDFQHDVGRMREQVEAAGNRAIVYFCNPNNPTATVTASADIESWIEEAPESVLFIIDEAYYEYVDHAAYRTALPWVQRRPNLLVVRTFSKIHGMAGMRLGFGIADPATAARLRAYIGHNNISQPAIAAALASLGDADVVKRGLSVNAEAKATATRCLDELGLEYLPSQANFMMHRVPGALDEYQARMQERGYLVGRAFPPMLDYNRVSFGTPEQMAGWADTLHDFRRMGWV